MILGGRQVGVVAYAEPVDMRKSFNALSALVEQELGRRVLSGTLFLFVSKNRKRAKVLYFDGTGLCLFCKRLEKGKFAAVADRARNRSLQLTLTELAQFIEGSELIGKSPSLLTWADLTPRWPSETAQTK